MDRRDVAVAGVVALVTAASWTASIAYDAGQREADSYSAGQHWAGQHWAGQHWAGQLRAGQLRAGQLRAQRNEPDPAACEAEMMRIAGPAVIGGPWLAGCLAPVSPQRIG